MLPDLAAPTARWVRAGLVSSGWPGPVAVLAVQPHEEGRTVMASSGKKKTTFAKLAREQKLRERRQEKRAKKNARKRTGELDLAPPNDTEPAAADR